MRPAAGHPALRRAQSATADAIDGKAMRGSHSPIAERATHAWSLDSKSIWTDGAGSDERAR